MKKVYCALPLILASLPAQADDADATIQELKQHITMLQQRVESLESVRRTPMHAAQPAQAAASNKGRGSMLDMDVDNISVSTSQPYAEKMLNLQDNVTGKNLVQLKARQNGELKNGKLYLSTHLKGTVMGEVTNEDGKFPILSRFPNQHSDDSGSRAIINIASVGVTAAINPYVTTYLQFDYSEVEYPSQDEFQMRKAFATIGNLDESPFYLMFGRNSIDFGNMDSYNPYTHTVNNHFFQAVSDEPTVAVGYYNHGYDVVLTAINGGRQLRVADREGGNHFRNFAVNASKTFTWNDNALKFGGGYLYGTIYRSDFTNHTRADQANTPAGTQSDRNGAWDAYIEYTTPQWDLMAEVTRTEEGWPATKEAVLAWTVQGAYRTLTFNVPSEFSLVYGRGEQGPEGTEYESLQQAVAGYEAQVWDNAYLGAEYVYNKGFVPLINITQTSDADVETHSVILGGRLVF